MLSQNKCTFGAVYGVLKNEKGGQGHNSEILSECTF